MRLLLCVCLALGATMDTPTVVPQDGDATAIQGMWKPVKADLGGEPLPEALLKSITLKLAGGKYEVFVGNAPDRGTYALDVSSKPRGITVAGTEGPNIGKTFPSIYELKGDTLRICYDLSGVKRPATFESVGGTKLYLVTYVRSRA